jgi:hypothetical protein
MARRLQRLPVAGAVDAMESFTDGLFWVLHGLSAGRPRIFDVLSVSERDAASWGGLPENHRLGRALVPKSNCARLAPGVDFFTP